jgi:hypothetical protein
VADTLDHGDPQNKEAALKLLQKLLHRLTQESREAAVDVEFAKQILLRLLGKVSDLYCCTLALETVYESLVQRPANASPQSDAFRAQLFTADIVERLLKGISVPHLNLQSYN